MLYGNVNFEHVWKFQIGCMMSNQFPKLVDAISNKSTDDVIVACLRLGWNDAFKHVSENTPWFNTLDDTAKQVELNNACKNLVPYFKSFARKIKTADRYTEICKFLIDPAFVSIFMPIKEVASKKYPLCLGHIQKMFNIAMKLLLCLILSAEHAITYGMKVKLGIVHSKAVYLTDLANGIPLLSYENFPYAFDTADCPIDHIVLKSIEKDKTPSHSHIYGHKRYDQIVWSKMGDPSAGYPEDQRNYISAQQEIENIQSNAKSNLCFDFENWK